MIAPPSSKNLYCAPVKAVSQIKHLMRPDYVLSKTVIPITVFSLQKRPHGFDFSLLSWNAVFHFFVEKKDCHEYTISYLFKPVWFESLEPREQLPTKKFI